MWCVASKRRERSSFLAHPVYPSDLAWLVISRFILLDSMLLFFTFTTVYFLACFNNCQRRPFEEEWWVFLTLTGISIGCVARYVESWSGLDVKVDDSGITVSNGSVYS